MFKAYDFTKDQRKRSKTRSVRKNSVKNVLSFAIGWRRSIMGCVNLRLVGNADGTVITVSPQRFASIWPEASANAMSGVVYLTVKRAEELGFKFPRELEEVTIA